VDVHAFHALLAPRLAVLCRLQLLNLDYGDILTEDRGIGYCFLAQRYFIAAFADGDYAIIRNHTKSLPFELFCAPLG
jgi:hypothetical protein